MTAHTINRNDDTSWPDAAFIERAIDQANLNALRLALFQQTGDPALAAMRLEPRAVRGGSTTVMAVAPSDRAALKRKALDYLTRGLATPQPPPDAAQT